MNKFEDYPCDHCGEQTDSEYKDYCSKCMKLVLNNDWVGLKKRR